MGCDSLLMVLSPRDFYFAGPEVEAPNRYHPGGFHPVHLGEVYNESYRIIHKLGFGTYSTVWLARDLRYAQTRYVALKFNIAQLTNKSSEILILKHLALESHGQPGFDRLLGFLDHFRIRGVNGTHDVLVTEVVGPRLGDMINEDPELLQKQAKALFRQIILGAAHLHESGIVHGDLHTGNVAFEILDLNGMPEQSAMMCLGVPHCIPVIPRNHEHQTESLPKYLVMPGTFVDHLVDASEPLQVKIIDFGEAYFTHSRPAGLNVPIAFRAPELIFNKRSLNTVDEDWDSRTDTWSLGCLLYEVVSTSALFHPVGDEDRMIFDMVTVAGKLPERWEEYWDWSKNVKPEANGKLQSSLEVMLKDLEEYQALTQDDTLHLADLLKQMLALDPQHRPIVAEILQHPWLND